MARIPKSLRNAGISAGILLAIFVLGGVAYTYFVGQSGPQKTAKVNTPPPTELVIKPIQPAANAPESAAVQIITSPVAVGSNASISVKTNAGSTCTISAVYNNVASTDSGLAAKTADVYGTVNWTWTVGAATPVGTWPVKVTCTYHTRTAVVQADLTVQK